jgi:hypothetical protein
MTLTTIDESQRRAARVAGLAGLLTMPFVVFANFAIQERLVVGGDVAAMARNILAHETLFRFSIACDLIYSAGLMVLASALYVILRPVNRNLALLATFWRLVYALMWVRMTLNLFDALRILGADYLRVFEAGQLQSLARLSLSARSDQYYVGLLFWALAATACSYLLHRSNYIPRSLAAFGIVASAWCVACTLAFIIFPAFAEAVNLWWFDSPLALFEIATSFWLLFKGLPASGIAEPHTAGNRGQANAA